MFLAFHKLTAQIGTDVAGIFGIRMKDEAIVEAGTPLTREALGYSTECQFIWMLSNCPDHPC
jgi:hypothetical protein